VFTVDELPGAAEKHRAGGFETLGGGPAATAAFAVARLGGRASLAARVGDDPAADLIVSELTAAGVDCSLVRRHPGHTSSVSAVLVDARGERQIVNYLDDSMPVDAGWLPGELPAGVTAVLVDTRWPAGALHGLELARKTGVPGVLDADLPVPGDGRLVASASHVVFSAPGLSDYTGERDAGAALRQAAATTGAWCAVTLGAEGTLAICDGRLERHPAFDVPVADTLGAGDVWHGAFACALAGGAPLPEALRFAAGAAALKVRNGNGRLGAPSRRQVETFLGAQAQEHSQ